MDKKITLLVVVLGTLALLGFAFDKGYLGGGEIARPAGKFIEAKSRQALIVGTHPKYPPMESIDKDGNFIGMDIDIAKEVAKDIGVTAIFKSVPWENIFDEVRGGNVDMIISAITITQERGETMNFSDPYFNAGQVAVGLKELQQTISKPEDLEGKKVGAQINTTSEKEARKYSPIITTLDNNFIGEKKLFSGELEAIVMDYPTAVDLVTKNPKLVILTDIFTQEFYGIATQKGQDELISQINKTIRRLKRDGELKRLETKWLTQQ